MVIIDICESVLLVEDSYVSSGKIDEMFSMTSHTYMCKGSDKE